MEHINETITLTGNTGLMVDVSRIVYADEAAAEEKSRPRWMTHSFTKETLAKRFALDEYGILSFTEDNFETYLREWLETTVNAAVKSFRWVWDKFYDFKAA